MRGIFKNLQIVDKSHSVHRNNSAFRAYIQAEPVCVSRNPVYGEH